MRTIQLRADLNTKDAEASARRLGKAIESEFKRIKQQFSNFGGSTTTSTSSGGINADLRRAQAEIKKYQQQQIRAEKALTTQVEREARQQAAARTREMKRSANEMIAAIRRVEAEEKKASSAFKGGFAGGFLGTIGASAIASITSALSVGGAAVFEYSKNVEGLTIAFEQFAGSAEGAKKQIAELQKFSLTTPFGLADLAQASQRLQGVGVESKKVIPLLKDIGNIVAGTGKVSVERFEGITTAITQMISKTKVSAEEMEQLAERGVPAWKLLADATGNTQAQLRKLGEQGKLTSDVMVAALQKIAKEKYGDAMDKQNKTLEGSMNRIKNILLEAARVWFQPLYEEASRFGATFAERIAANETKSKSILENFGFSLGQSIKRGVDSGYLSISSVVDTLIGGGGATTAGINAGRGIVGGYNTPQGATPPVSQSTGMENYDPYGAYNPKKVTEAQTKMFDVLDAEAEKRKKEREQAAKAELQARINLYMGQINDITRIQSEAFDKLAEQFKETGDAKSFAEGFNETVRKRNAELPQLVEQWEELVRQQTLAEKKGQFQIEEIYKETTRKKDELIKHGLDLTTSVQKLIKEGVKKSSEEEIKIAEEATNRKIELEKAATETRLAEIEQQFKAGLIASEKAYLDEKTALQAGALEKEKTYLTELLAQVQGNAEKQTEVGQKLLVLDEQIKKQKVESADEVFEAQKKLAEKEREAYEKFADIVGGLDEELASLNAELGISAEMSERDVWAKDLQKEAYKNLTKESKDLILAKADEVDAARAAIKAQDEYKDAFENMADSIESHLEAFADGGFKGLFQSILDEMKRFLIRAAAEFLTSRFLKLITGQDSAFGGSRSGGGGIGSILGSIFGGGGSPGGTPGFNPNNFTGGGSSGGGIGGLLSGIFGGGGGGSSQGGNFGGAGAGGSWGAASGGGGIGGILGKFGKYLPFLGIGIGLLGSLFGGDPKRKADKKENLPALQAGFTDALMQLRNLVNDVRSLRVEPESALSKATELRQQIASGFGIQFQSKKYSKQSKQLIASKLIEADSLIKQIREAADVATSAGERRRRILPEFADGGVVSQFFRNNFSGLVPGIYDRKDDKLIKVTGNEVVLTPNQWQPITPYLQAKKVKGFADGGFVGGSAMTAPAINVSINMYERADGGFDAYLTSEQGEKAIKVTVNRLKKNKEI